MAPSTTTETSRSSQTNGKSATNGKSTTNGSARNGKAAATKRRGEQRPSNADAKARAKLASLPPPPDPPVSHVEAVPTEAEPELSPARPRLRLTQAPSIAPRRQRRRTLARRRTDVVRRISTWSVLKVSLLFWLAMWIVLLIAGAILWRVGESAGLVTNVESFWAEATGQESVSWDGQALLRTAGMAGAVLAFAATGLTVLCTMLFNVICDLTGGIRVSALELVGKAEQPPSEAGAPAPVAEEPEPAQAQATEWPVSRRAG